MKLLPCRGCRGRLFLRSDFDLKRREGWDFYPGGEVYTATHRVCHAVRVLTKAQYQALTMRTAQAVRG